MVPLDLRPPARPEACTGPGYVLVRHRGAGLGVGWLRPASLRSLFPKRW